MLDATYMHGKTHRAAAVHEIEMAAADRTGDSGDPLHLIGHGGPAQLRETATQMQS